MIVRVFRVVVFDDKREQFESFFRETAVPLMKSQPGIVSLTFGLPRPETPNEFCIVMVWRDLDADEAARIAVLTGVCVGCAGVVWWHLSAA